MISPRRQNGNPAALGHQSNPDPGDDPLDPPWSNRFNILHSPRSQPRTFCGRIIAILLIVAAAHFRRNNNSDCTKIPSYVKTTAHQINEVNGRSLHFVDFHLYRPPGITMEELPTELSLNSTGSPLATGTAHRPTKSIFLEPSLHNPCPYIARHTITAHTVQVAAAASKFPAAPSQTDNSTTFISHSSFSHLLPP